MMMYNVSCFVTIPITEYTVQKAECPKGEEPCPILEFVMGAHSWKEGLQISLVICFFARNFQYAFTRETDFLSSMFADTSELQIAPETPTVTFAVNFPHRGLNQSEMGTTVPVVNIVNKTTQERDLKDIDQVHFWHVGKTGGTTVSGLLAAGCHAKRNKRNRAVCLENLSPSSLSLKVNGVTHFHSSKLKVRPKAHLITVRNPLERAISWYYYSHPKNCETSRSSVSCQARNEIKNSASGYAGRFFEECFPQLENLARSLQPSSRQDNCTSLAKQTLSGNFSRMENAAGHMIRNLQWYIDQAGFFENMETTRNEPLFVVRTENLMEDLRAINNLLGGKDEELRSNETRAITHGSEHNVVKLQSLEPLEYRGLCCAGLLKELLAYQKILLHAINLNQTERNESWKAALDSCGISHHDGLEIACQKFSSPVVDTVELGPEED